MAKSNMKKYERICSCCDHHYFYCKMGCSEYAKMEPWHDAYCSKNCMDLYNITVGYLNDWLPKEQEAERLKAIDLSYFDHLADWMKEPILEMKKMWGDTEENKEETEDKEVKVEEKTEDTNDNDAKNDEPKKVKDEVKNEVNEEVKEYPKSKDYTKDYSKNRYRAKNK